MFANNKDADQPGHPHRLISALVIPLLERIISKLAASKISIVLLVSAAEETGLSLEDKFCRDEAHINLGNPSEVFQDIFLFTKYVCTLKSPYTILNRLVIH